MNTYHTYTVHMSPTLNGSSALKHYECGNVIEIRNGIMFDFYLGLPQFSYCLILVSVSTQVNRVQMP